MAPIFFYKNIVWCVLRRFHRSRKTLKWFFSFGTLAYEEKEYFVDSESKSVYVVNSKVACSSIKKAMMGKCAEDADGYDVHKLAYELGFQRKSVPKSTLKEYYVFTVVRNPLHRVLSAYLNKFKDIEKISKTDFEYSDYLFGFLSLKDDFGSFVEKISSIPVKASEKHFYPQYEWIIRHVSFGQIAIKRLEDVSEGEVADSFCSTYGLSGQAVNKTGSYKLSDFYSKRLALLVYEKYKNDFKEFGYEDDFWEFLKGLS